MIILPNKLYNFNDSVLSKLTKVLKTLDENELSTIELYRSLIKDFSDIEEFINTLTCLYALNRIYVKNGIIKIR